MKSENESRKDETKIGLQRQTNKQTDKQTNRQTDKQTNRQTNKQTDRQTNKQTNKRERKKRKKKKKKEFSQLVSVIFSFLFLFFFFFFFIFSYFFFFFQLSLEDFFLLIHSYFLSLFACLIFVLSTGATLSCSVGDTPFLGKFSAPPAPPRRPLTHPSIHTHPLHTHTSPFLSPIDVFSVCSNNSSASIIKICGRVRDF